MADHENGCSVSALENIEELLSLVWGENVKEDIFQRWSQGFCFSPEEPTALVQEQGGPCAVIASVQAYLLKNILFMDDNSDPDSWRQLSDEQAKHFLVCSLCEMLNTVKTEPFTLVFLKDYLVSTQCMRGAKTSTNKEETQSVEDCSVTTDSSPVQHPRQPCIKELSSLSSKLFHSNLCQVKCHLSENVRQIIETNINMLERRFGVVLFLYSMLLTKGLRNVKGEMEDVGESLVDRNFGHGSQTLINLMLTGFSVSNVWNSSRVLSGLELKGIPRQSLVGFLTLLEAHRYCEVGSFLKSPVFPIWLLGSETHLTVFFTQDRSLGGEESEREKGLRVFKSFDQQDNGFITTDQLGNVLEALELVTDPDYVSFMKSRLDQDSMGIILIHKFLEEFFPGKESPSSLDVKPFSAYHYNGLGVRDDNGSKRVVYTQGIACVEPSDFSHMAEQQIITCLKTKWAGISVDWHGKLLPSLN